VGAIVKRKQANVQFGIIEDRP